MPAEFTCCECGCAIVGITYEEIPCPPLCAACMTIPGWFTVPEIREKIMPDHDGIDRSIKQRPRA